MTTATETEAEVLTRRCIVCQDILPLTAEFFHRHRSYAGGHRSVCKTCRNAKRLVDRQERYGKAVKTLLLRTARDIKAGRIAPGHVEVMAILFRFLHGAEGVAKAFKENFFNPRSSPRHQLTILLAMQKTTEIVDEARREEAARHDSDLKKMSREELEKSILHKTDQLLQEYGLKIVPIEAE